jgi:hypothetical protein
MHLATNVEGQLAMCAMLLLASVDGQRPPEGAWANFFPGVVSWLAPAHRSAITSRNGRFVSTAARNRGSTGRVAVRSLVRQRVEPCGHEFAAWPPPFGRIGPAGGRPCPSCTRPSPRCRRPLSGALSSHGMSVSRGLLR